MIRIKMVTQPERPSPLEYLHCALWRKVCETKKGYLTIDDLQFYSCCARGYRWSRDTTVTVIAGILQSAGVINMVSRQEIYINKPSDDSIERLL